MSNKALNWAFNLPLKGSRKTVLIVLADHSNEKNDYKCWPSVRRIAERAGISQRAVRSALRYLEAEALIETHHHTGKRSDYKLNVPRSATENVSLPATTSIDNFRPTPEATSAPPRNSFPPNRNHNLKVNPQHLNTSKTTCTVGERPNGYVGVSNDTPLREVAMQIESILCGTLSSSDHQTLRWLLSEKKVHSRSLLNEIDHRVERDGLDCVRADMRRHHGLRTFVDGVFERIGWRRMCRRRKSSEPITCKRSAPAGEPGPFPNITDFTSNSCSSGTEAEPAFDVPPDWREITWPDIDETGAAIDRSSEETNDKSVKRKPIVKG